MAAVRVLVGLITNAEKKVNLQALGAMASAYSRDQST